MSFADIAYKSVRRKLGSYLIFFLSTVFSVVIFSLFCSLYYNPAFEAYRFGAGKMTTLFRGSAVAVLLFASVFVLYSGSYFLKTQKKEIAIYSLLGMRKEKIALLMFLETFFIGLLAVACGTAAGVLFSGYFTRLLMRFMAVGTEFTFSVAPQAITATVLAFAALFAVSGVRAYAIIYRYSLIDLLSASKKSEGVPGYSRVGAVAAAALLAVGYIISGQISMYDGGFKLLLPAFCVIMLVGAGTYLLFCNLVPMAVSALKKCRRVYFKTASFISLSQVSFRLKANSRLLSVTAILCAVTVTMVSASYSLYRGLEDGTRYYAPFSYLVKDASPELEDALLRQAEEVGEISVTAQDSIILLKASFRHDGYGLQHDQGEAETLGSPVEAYLLSESAYLKIIDETNAAVGGNGNLVSGFSGGLSEDQCFFIEGNVTSKYSEELTQQQSEISAVGESLRLTVTGTSLHKYLGLMDNYHIPTVVVNDSLFDRLTMQAPDSDKVRFFGLMFDDDMGSARTVDALNAIAPPRFNDGILPPNLSYIGMYKSSFRLYGSYVFIGLFIGILFMLATGSVLYYKLIMEAQEEAPRYGLMRKLGLTEREALSAELRQLGLAFVIPFLVGLVHSVFALGTYNRMMDLVGQETPTLQNAALVVAIFAGVYLVFYALAVRSCHKIVWQSGN